MIFVLTLRKEFHYEIEVSAKMVDIGEGKKMVYVAELAESGQISHFDTHFDYEGESIEAAILSIAVGLEAALVMLHSF